MKTNLLSRTWWKAALLRALYTAIAIAIPYIAAVQLADVPWLLAASAAGVGVVLSLATSLAGLPEAVGVDLPWWLAALERTAKTFAQALAGGLTGAVFLHDIDWAVLLQAAAGAALLSLLRLILATLPADPTPVLVVHESDPVVLEPVQPPVNGVDVEQMTDLSTTRRYPLN